MTPAVESILDVLAVAVRPGATDHERHLGAVVARALAASLDAAPAVLPAAASPATTAVPAPTALAPPASALAPTLPTFNPFTGMSADQILEVAIGHLRGIVGATDVAAPVGQPFQVNLVPVPRPR